MLSITDFRLKKLNFARNLDRHTEHFWHMMKRANWIEAGYVVLTSGGHSELVSISGQLYDFLCIFIWDIGNILWWLETIICIYIISYIAIWIVALRARLQNKLIVFLLLYFISLLLSQYKKYFWFLRINIPWQKLK